VVSQEADAFPFDWILDKVTGWSATADYIQKIRAFCHTMKSASGQMPIQSGFVLQLFFTV
jgi:hypothetical protein